MTHQADIVISGGGMDETGFAKGPVDLLPGRTPQRRDADATGGRDGGKR